MENVFRAAQGRGAVWHQACAQCIEQLAGPPAGYLGFVYASDPLADALDLIVGRLREATGISTWIGTGAAGVCAGGQEYIDDGAIVRAQTEGAGAPKALQGLRKLLAALANAT